MPNWVFNSLVIEAEPQVLSQIRAQLSAPYEMQYVDWRTNEVTKEMVQQPLSFWNIIKPEDLEAYHDKPDKKQDLNDPNHWYSWNIRNWGVKWDAKEVYESDEFTEGDKETFYNFDTPWGVPESAMLELSRQYPTAKLSLEFEEEQGWGGEIVFTNGEGETIEEYNDKCRQCGALDQMEMCEHCENYLCTKCNYGSFIDEDTLKECEVHKELAKEVSA
jgi:ribosomal protein S27AE